MKQKWPCASCRLAGHDDFMKKIEDFGVRMAADFRDRLLPQGVWARCNRCSHQRKASTAAGASAGGSANTEAQQLQRRGVGLRLDERRLAASQAMAKCTQCGKDAPRTGFWPADWYNRDQGIKCQECEPRPPAERGVGRGHLNEALQRLIDERKILSFTCRTCDTEKPRTEFWPKDIDNRIQNGGLSCTACQPTPPSERPRVARNAILSFTCRACGMEKPRAEYWPGDIPNRQQNGGLSCTTCEPTPPSERRKRKKTGAQEPQ